ncbi:MAG: DUF58 domain-containing protein [Elusimicrobia bacterium]|nr:DUF58 domain-containing protein [Elusimicrobiota bacterium]
MKPSVLERLRWGSFRLGSRILHFADQRFTPAGRLGLAGVVLSAVAGFDTNASMAYQAFCFLTALLCLSALAALFRRPSFSVERSLPRFGTAGSPLPYTLLVRNKGSASLQGLTLREETADPRPSLEEFVGAKPTEKVLPLGDRIWGWARWRRLVAERAIASVADVALPEIPPGGTCRAQATIVPMRRGRFKLSAVTVARPDPAGLVLSRARQATSGLVMILPKRYPVPQVALPGRRRYQQGGVALSSSIGESQEFMSLRDYRPGDPLRRIHWRSWAKTGRPIVRECQDEYFVRHGLILDTFLDGYDPQAFEEAVSVAASFACSILTQESLLDLLFVGDEAYCFTAGRGLAGSGRMLEILASVEPCRSKGFATLRHSVLRRHQSLSGVICVLLAWDAERRELIQGLRATGVPVQPLVVCKPGTGPGPEQGAHVLEVGRIAEGLASL